MGNLVEEGNNNLHRYVTTKDGNLYNGILASDFKDGVCVWSCSRLGSGEHVGYVGQEKYGLTSTLCETCEVAREQMVAILQGVRLQRVK